MFSAIFGGGSGGKTRKTSAKTKKRSKVDNEIYKNTKKPKFYVEVENPPKTDDEKRANLQKARQVGFNKWSILVKYHSGSYLPNNPEQLQKCNGNWVKSKSPSVEKGGKLDYYNMNTKQNVRFDVEDENQYDHWHWHNVDTIDKKGFKESNCNAYRDIYGNECPKKEIKQIEARRASGSTNTRAFNHHIGLNGRKYEEKITKKRRKKKF